MEYYEDYPQIKHRPIQIVSSDNHTFKLQNAYSLEQILNSPKLKDHHIVVVSIAGALRKGKSFLLTFFLKYLIAQYKKHDVVDWIGKSRNETVTEGFPWRGGKDRETIGIWMWSEIFTHSFPDGDKVAIILMDTQGIFDNKSSLNECISIFAMSMLLSSVQCFNVMRQVQEDDLTNLELFTEYAKLASKDTNEKPFQNLLFIVRDWPSPDDNAFGPSKDYVTDLLSKKLRQTTKMHELRDAIKKSFDKIDAFLMPYPGRDVDQHRSTFRGEVDKIEPEFVDCAVKLTEQLFAPENLIRKKIGGEMFRAADFLTFLQKYVELFSGDELPQPITILQGTADAHLKLLYEKCLNDYIDEMHEALRSVDTYCSDAELQQKHLRATENAMKRFKENPKLGGLELQCNYMKMLERKIDDNYKIFCQKNTAEKENASSVKKAIIATFSGAAAIAGAVGSYLVAGPSGLRLFLTALGSAFGGGGVGAGVNSILPSSWTNSDSLVGRTTQFLLSNFNQIEKILPPRNRAITSETRTRSNATTTANGTNTTANTMNADNNPLSRVWNGAKSIAINAINKILHFRFRQN